MIWSASTITPRDRPIHPASSSAADRTRPGRRSRAAVDGAPPTRTVATRRSGTASGPVARRAGRRRRVAAVTRSAVRTRSRRDAAPNDGRPSASPHRRAATTAVPPPARPARYPSATSRPYAVVTVCRDTPEFAGQFARRWERIALGEHTRLRSHRGSGRRSTGPRLGGRSDRGRSPRAISVNGRVECGSRGGGCRGDVDRDLRAEDRATGQVEAIATPEAAGVVPVERLAIVEQAHPLIGQRHEFGAVDVLEGDSAAGPALEPVADEAEACSGSVDR